MLKNMVKEKKRIKLEGDCLLHVALNRRLPDKKLPHQGALEPISGLTGI